MGIPKFKTPEEILEEYEKKRVKQLEANKRYYKKVKDTQEWKQKKRDYYYKKKEESNKIT